MSKRFWPVIIVVMSTGYLCFHSAAAIEILNDGSYWRYHVMLRQPVVQDKDSSLTGGTGVSGRILKVHVDYRSYPGLGQLETPAPPTNWISPEFDDAAWPREKMSSSGAGSIRQIMRSPGLEFLVGQLCVRGRFAVTDP
ncbi:MAG: hypothetical protein N2255_08390, partial [Kiritimatiellae bacterium]|nr:hypothetical protein [Kiritimatiellia bacterium]